MKIHQLAAAVSLALVAGNASAALTPGSQLGAPSSLIFAIGDPVSNKTFILDLAEGGHAGLNYKSFVTGSNGTNGNLSWDLSSFSPFASNGYAANNSTFYWSVIGGYALDNDNATNLDKTGVHAPFTDSAGVQWGLLSTSENSTSFSELDYTVIATELQDSGAVGRWINVVNSEEGINGANVGSIAAVGQDNFYALNLLGLGGALDAPGAPTLVGPGSAGFYYVTNNDINNPVNSIQKLGNFSLTANNQLTWSPNSVAAVPLPGAVWLFGSALMGFLGYSKRRNTADAV